MLQRLVFVVLGFAVIGHGAALAQVKVRTETIRPPASASAQPPAPSAATEAPQTLTARKPARAMMIARRNTDAALPEIITDLSRLPPAVAATRERIIAAARSGDLEKVATVMQMSEVMPVFSLGDDKDPVTNWKANFPDSDGLEVLATLMEILDAGFVHVDKGTPQEMYVWPYFARYPLDRLTTAQKVELFRIVTGSDYKEMEEEGHYIFYRVGIGPDGTWHFFVAGD